ncbi:hypothetical protein FRACYDRAFT_240917 [Fragilariopsis cylindrus CCMP1102]|uniref:Uncharacterized protein n=1 Tax=Fragilariopsis cylindrus CCMP1102 TaxID=635003 RepID=A0A1E7F895_9STRA|nr:hypothetical protein FRACYDRAFT_240917 [Fragilariopsis cylindrus CCMP1102]|eukprot:OEU14377.1 hypothetical protein FRACYDRAFT_240917 [Fragilariopsis cylindrus CCMP1102]
MEWPIVNLPETIGNNNTPQYLKNLTTIVFTKEIYSRAARACISDITINHVDNGLKQKVHTYLNNLQKIDIENWNNTSYNSDSIDTPENNTKNGYRTMAHEFMELMTYAASCNNNSNGRIIDICQGGLDAVHDLFKYRLPTGSSVLAAKDAYILCSSLCTSSTIKLSTNITTGSRSPDIDYKFGLYTNDNGNGTSNTNVEQDDINKLYSGKACNYITKLRLAGQIETSASSLAKYTLMNSDIVSKLTNKTFIVLGCDHPLSPTKSLLRIPNVTVIGIPQSWIGLDRIIEYVQYNSPDDTTFIYPTISSNDATSGNSTKRNDGNLILSHGPHIVQWILDNTTRILSKDSSSNEHEFVLVPMPMMSLWSSLSSSYLPPELSVRYSASSDLIIQRLIGSIVGSTKAKISIWMYQSSTTCMIVPPASTTKSKELLSKRPSHEAWIHALSMNTVLTPQFEVDTSVSNSNVDNDVSEKEEAVTTVADTVEEKKTTTTARVHNNNNHDYAIVNGIITSSSTIGGSCGGCSSGSHHVLAEMIRMWRCLIINLSHNHPNEGNIDGSYDSDEDSDDDDDDVTNATNQNYVHVFAPYVPILKNIAKFFFTDTNILEPNLKIFDVNVASSLMTAIGLAGLCDPLVNRPMPTIDDGYTSQYNSTPFSMFWNGSVHGGIWNCPYTLDSTLNGYTSYLLGKQKQNDNEIIIDHVPSKLLVLQDGNSDEQPPMDETMPDCVRERLEIL